MQALLIVDVQNDFLPRGALPVEDGNEIVPLINNLQPHYPLVVAVRDWHPLNHVSFASSHPGRRVGDVVDADGLDQQLWPAHCVQGTWGAQFPPGLHIPRMDAIIHKGQMSDLDSYSAFFGNGHRRSTGLDGFLRGLDVTEVHICGLTLNICVHATAMDARQLGYKTTVIVDATRGLEYAPGVVERACDEMVQAGARLRPAAEVA